MAKYTNQLHSPQSNFDNDATNNPIRFIELPLGKIPSAILVTPGTILRTKSKHYDEKYLAILHTHVNKLLKLNPQFNVKRYVSIFLFHETGLSSSFNIFLPSIFHHILLLNEHLFDQYL